jgi:hypothetical protein
MSLAELTQTYLESGWEVWEEGPRVVKFRRGGLIAWIVEHREGDWRSGKLEKGHDAWGNPLT